MTTISTNFTSAVAGGSLSLPFGANFLYSLSGTYAASMILEYSTNTTSWYPVIKSAVANATVTSTKRVEECGPGSRAYYRWRADTYTSGTAVTSLTDDGVAQGSEVSRSIDGITISGPVVRMGQVYTFTASGLSKIGATAGWVAEAADNIALRTLPQSQTGSTLILPLPGLKVGWTVTAFALIGQIESAGGSVTLAASLRKQTAAAADVTDALVGTMTSLVVTGDTLVSSANASLVLATPETIAEGENLYLLITGTTAATTDIALMGATVTVNET